jgi:lysophospholipid acyltransferase (LPLAT)-like uncharacterized protein
MLLIAQDTGAPIYPVQAWAKRKLLMRTWDRTLIPLPFNRLVFLLGEPVRVPRDADKDTVEALRAEPTNLPNGPKDSSKKMVRN